MAGCDVFSGRIDGASVLTFTLSGASLFVGAGVALNDKGTATLTDDGIDTDGAIGFSVTGVSLSFATVTKGTESFTGLRLVTWQKLYRLLGQRGPERARWQNA